MVEDVSVATADAVTIRMLTVDGTQLVRVGAYHPDPQTAAAIASVMAGTADARSGLWGDVITHRRSRRWHVDPVEPPREASTAQEEFIGRFEVRAVLGVPLLDQGVVVGGLSLFRIGVDRPYTDEEQELAEVCAALIAPVVGLRRSSMAPDASSSHV